jgi:hypothetical protein
VYSYSKIEAILDVYTFKEIVEYNDLTIEDILFNLVTEGILKLPDFKPL